MRIVFYQNSISPHQLPLAREVAKILGSDNMRYVYVADISAGRLKCGWANTRANAGVHLIQVDEEGARDWLENADVVYTGLRDFALFSRRRLKELKTFYVSERWFKPIQLSRYLLPGWLRIVSPRYLMMLVKFVRWQNSDSRARCFAVGPDAAKDFNHIGIPLDKIIPWGYYVEQDQSLNGRQSFPVHKRERRILWVGRMVALKRVDTIINALRLLVEKKVQSTFTYTLTLVGEGPEQKNLQKISSGLPVHFIPFQPIESVRGIMRDHDIFVFASNGLEGWGAVVNEALAEGLVVLGSAAPGSCRALLPHDRLFEVGDYRRLAKLLSVEWTVDGLEERWTPKGAAKALVKIAKEDY